VRDYAGGKKEWMESELPVESLEVPVT